METKIKNIFSQVKEWRGKEITDFQVEEPVLYQEYREVILFWEDEYLFKDNNWQDIQELFLRFYWQEFYKDNTNFKHWLIDTLDEFHLKKWIVSNLSPIEYIVQTQEYKTLFPNK